MFDETPLPTDPQSPPPSPVMPFPPQDQRTTGFKPYPQMIPLLDDKFQNMTLVGTIKIYKDALGKHHVASG